MEDCKGTCAYEGKQIKRQLQRWSRTFPAQIGLECVLAELVGHGRWRRLRHHMGAADALDGAASPPRDWQPAENGASGRPCLCVAAATATPAPAAAVSSAPVPTAAAAAADSADSAPAVSRPPGQGWPMSVSRCTASASLESVSASPAAYSAALSLQRLVGGRRSPPPQSLPLPPLSQQEKQQQQQQQQRPALPEILWTETLSYYQSLLASRVSAGVSDQERADTPPDDQPLDLSCSRAPPPPPPPPLAVTTAVRPPRKSEAAPPAKKPYTEEELQAALRDIQSGRLGTRRAAVIYGIPRSTLRNKVYRLAAQGKRAEQLAEAKQTPPPPPPPPPPAAAVVSAVPEPEPDTAAAVEAAKAPVEPPSQLLQARLTQPIESAEPVRAAVMSWMYSGVLQRALQAREPAAARADQPPVWEDFVRRMSHERFNEVLAQLRAAGATAPPAAKQPPAPLLPVTVAAAAELSDSRTSEDAELTPTTGDRKRKLELAEDNNNTVPATKSTKTNKAATKGSRPKRGKYRNYNRSHLADAVRAVQSGEMSVHRAGNFYGVPHSTLEYKVKQRHLDRAGRRERPAERPASAVSPVPADRVATSGGVMMYRSAGSPPPAGAVLPSEVLRRLADGESPASQLLDKTALTRVLGGSLSISGITNRAHTAGGQVLQTTESS